MGRAEDIKKEVEELIYEKPSNDFEHIWNCAIDKALACFYGYDLEDES